MSVFLATTSLEKFWDKEAEKIVFLGKWCCKESKKSNWEKLNGEILPICIKDSEELNNILNYERSLFDKIIPNLTDFLNKYHKVRYTQDQWIIMIGSWLEYFISIMHMRYLEVNTAISLYPDFKTIILDENNYYSISDYVDLTKKVETDIFNLQCYSEVFKFMNCKYDVKNYNENRKINHIRKKLKQVKKYSLKVACSYLLRKFSKVKVTNNDINKNAKIIIIKTNWDQSVKNQVSQKSNGEIEVIDKQYGYSVEQSIYQQRHQWQFSISEVESKFEEFIEKIIPYYIPIAFMEGFSEIKSRKKMFDDISPQIIVTQGGWQVDSELALWISEQRERGTALFGLQHAANSNVYKNFDWLEERCSDKFFTWGWGEEEKKRKKMPVVKHRLIEPAVSVKDLDTILLPQAFVIRNFNSKYSPFYFEEDDKIMYSFIQNLMEEYRKKLIYREYPASIQYDTTSWLRSKFPYIKKDNMENAYFISASKAKLIVVTYFGNTYMESLLLNKPTIIINTFKYAVLEERFRKDIIEMEKRGILYTSAEEAATFINSTYNNIEEWWFEPERQKLVQELCYKYIWTCKEAINIWISELTELKKNLC